MFEKEIWIVLLMREHGIQLFLKMGFKSGRLEVNLSDIKFSAGTITYQQGFIKCARVKMTCWKCQEAKGCFVGMSSGLPNMGNCFKIHGELGQM